MHYGSAGKNLEINLSTGKSLKTEVDTTARGMYLGGRGTNTKLFWDRVPPETDPYSADNLMVFGVGILTGTLAPGANRTILTTLSPQTNLQTYSSLGGFWGAELKHAGYDNLIVSGKSSKPVYLWINGDKAEIRDASHLWGKDVRETSKIIRDELKQNRAQVLSIGQAGENRVLAATIEHGSGTGASRAGVGAVMGDKKLKAIAVYGTNDIHIARPADFYELCEHILKKTDGIRAYFDRMSYECHEWFMNNWAWGNLGPKRPFDNAGEYHENFVKEFSSRTVGCFNCTLACKVNIKLPEGEYCSVKCQSWFAFMFAVKTRDLLFNARCVNLCEKFGLDTVSTACNIAFAIDLFEKGILTKADTQGEDLEWENQDLVLALIGKIARREGIGDILADGVYEAARQIGRSALKHAYHIKKLEMIAFQPTIPYCALRTAVTDRLDMTRAGSSAVSAMENTPKWKQEYVKAGYFHYPKEFEKPFVEAYVGLGRDYEKMVPFTSRDVDTNAIADSTGVCIFWTGFELYPPISVDDQINLMSYATGMDLDEAKTILIAKRINALTRAYNVRKGINRRADIKIPERFFRERPAPPDVKLDHKKFNKMISSYYKLRGWNYKGIPAKKELERLDLHDVWQDLEQRGYYKR